MYNGKKILALIPARGGSKGLRRKNALTFSGKPLIAWAIAQAKKSSYVDKILVSTDSKEILEIAKKYGADAPFLRPKRLSGSDSKTVDAVLHAIRWLEKNIMFYDFVIVLQPTSPFRSTADIDGAIKYLFLKKCKAVVSVCPASHNPLWANILPDNGSMKSFLHKGIVGRGRQKLPVFYRLNGAIYLACIDYLKKQKNFFGRHSYAYIMSKERSIDIDDKVDFVIAELLFKKEYVR